MSLCLPENYSVLNCYIYDDKSNTVSWLDTFSSPLRSFLGGKECYVMTQMEANAPSYGRISIIFFTAIAYYIYSPLLLVPCAALAVKFLFASSDRAEVVKKANTISELFEAITRALHQTCREEEYIRARALLLQAPGFKQNPSINEAAKRIDDYFFRKINASINSGDSWQNIEQDLSQLMDPTSIRTLVVYAIRRKLGEEIRTSCYTIKNDEVCSFVEKAFSLYPLNHTKEALLEIIRDVLPPDSTECTLMIAYRMYLADAMFNVIKKINQKLNSNRDVVASTIEDLRIQNVDRMFIKNHPLSYHYNALFNMPEKMKEISRIVEEFQKIMRGDYRERTREKLTEADEQLKLVTNLPY